MLISGKLRKTWKKIFKDGLKRFFKNKNNFTEIKIDKICPYCGEEIILNNFKTRNKIKFFTCSNDKCYYYGGVFKGNLKDL